MRSRCFRSSVNYQQKGSPTCFSQPHAWVVEKILFFNLKATLKDVTDELAHPSRVLFTEEVILGICMVITGLLYAFSQMPGTVLSTASASKSFMKQSVAGFAPASSR
jgi:hypothetical protein